MEYAGFVHNTTVQRRPPTAKPPSTPSSSNGSTHSHPRNSAKPTFDTVSKSKSKKPAPSLKAKSTASAKASANFEHIEHDHMLSTPLVDYKHAANQDAQARAAASKRKSSSTSGTSSERQHALQTVDSRQAAANKPGRSNSISSKTSSSGLTAVTTNDAIPTDPLLARPFARRNGRQMLRDVTLPYPLPCDLTEIHRQTLRTMLLCQVFNGPLCSPAFNKKPPKRVLEVGCGSGFWSVMCHRHFSQRGFTSISFTGVDIAPLAPATNADNNMNWRFVQHDLRRTPLPFRDEEFTLIMVKDMSLVISDDIQQQNLMEEYMRILKPGGVLEMWDGDHSIRMLLPHATPASDDTDGPHTHAMGTYFLSRMTPISGPQNQYFQDYNLWIRKALLARHLTDMPCTVTLTHFHEEEDLIEVDSRRLAIPLGEVRWEREGVGGSTNGKAKESDTRRLLTPGQAALRRTALMTVVQFIESMESTLREVSGKGQDEWDRWHGNMMADLLKNNGTSWGECLEVGAWWAKKVAKKDT